MMVMVVAGRLWVDNNAARCKMFLRANHTRAQISPDSGVPSVTLIDFDVYF